MKAFEGSQEPVFGSESIHSLRWLANVNARITHSLSLNSMRCRMPLQITHPERLGSQVPPDKLNSLLFPKLPQILNALFAKIEILHIGCVLCWRSGHSAGHHHRVGFEHDTIVHDFVNSQCDQIVILNDGALVCLVPAVALVPGIYSMREGEVVLE